MAAWSWREVSRRSKSSATVAQLLAAVGLPANSAAARRELVRLTCKRGEPWWSQRGACLRWDVGGGVELWVQRDRDGRVRSLQPHFSGASLVGVDVQARTSPARRTARQGLLTLLGPEQTTLCCAAPGCALLDLDELPAHYRCQVAAFADHMVVASDAEAARSAVRQGTRERLQSEPMGNLTGIVVKAAQRVNPFSDTPFLQIRLRCGGWTFDAVGAEGTLPQVPRPGEWIHGRFWLSTRLVDCPRQAADAEWELLFGC